MKKILGMALVAVLLFAGCAGQNITPKTSLGSDTVDDTSVDKQGVFFKDFVDNFDVENIQEMEISSYEGSVKIADVQTINAIMDKLGKVEIGEKADYSVTDSEIIITLYYSNANRVIYYFDSNELYLKDKEDYLVLKDNGLFKLLREEISKANEEAENNTSNNEELALNVTPSVVSTLKYNNYSDDEGLFTMNIPEGFAVNSTGGYLGHLIIAYDKSVNSRQIIYCDNLTGYSTQKEADIVKASTGQSFAVFNNLEELVIEAGKYSFGYTDFKVIERFEQNGQEVLHGTLVTNGTELECLVSAIVVKTGGVNLGGYTSELVFGDAFTMVTATPEEFTDWEPVLANSLSSLQFTNKFWSGRQNDWNQIIKTSMYISKASAQAAAIQMSGYENRRNSYDIQMQEYSDKTLGYDRYLDTQTGEVYKAEYGTMSGYSGSRYQKLESGSSYYNQAVAGYITK